METNPCKVCGGTDLNLIDGFYYCVECGTQDVEARETVVEKTLLGDGTFAQSAVRKITTALKDSLGMSGEWMKWHAYNFILAGLTEELISLGAKPKIKNVVLWIWIKYIKMFQDKDSIRNKTQFEQEFLNETNKSQKELDSHTSNTDNSDEEKNNKKTSKRNKKKRDDKFRRDIKIVTKGTLLTILYIALNLDKSDIQLSHLFRFIKEGRLSLYNCTKFVPKEIDMLLVPYGRNFLSCQNEYMPKLIREFAMTFFKRLDLGVPQVPNLTKIVNNFTKELCLPDDFKQLILSLMYLMPCDFLKLDSKSLKSLVRIPDYEGVCMCYVLIALKMCFGLDCDYEIKLSKAVDTINDKENHSKSYKLGFYSDSTNRLFSFHDWCKYLQLRKNVLCKNYLPISRIYNLSVDDCVLMEQLENRRPRNKKLSDDVTMDIINKISVDDNISVIPKNKFPSTLTPMTTYTDVILQHVQDPELRLLLCEDFTQYSLKYAIEELKLPDNENDNLNLIRGVEKMNKTFNPFVIGTLTTKKGDNTMVFVRNCDNSNWLKTKPPAAKHITKVNGKKNGDNNSDCGYESNIECTPPDSDDPQSAENVKINKEDHVEKKILEIIEEEDENVNIFDDDFINCYEVIDIINNVKGSTVDQDTTNHEIDHQEYSNFYDSKLDLHDTFKDDSDSIDNEVTFDPESFDKDKIINELLLIACKKYKIRIPKETKENKKEPYKRKQINDAEQNTAKRQKCDKEVVKESKRISKELIATYYETVKKDLINDIEENVRSIVQNMQEDSPMNGNLDDNISNINAPNDFYNESAGLDNDVSAISSIHPNNTLNDTNLEEEETADESIITNPKFDAKTHDTKQLYVKLNEDLILNYDFNTEDDVEIEKIIAKKVEEFANKENLHENIGNISDSSDSDDDLPLSEVAAFKKLYADKKNRRKTLLDNLVENRTLKTFCYWTRHYKSQAVARSADMKQKFDIELTENCPISFVFVISECAAILDCTTFSLYKCMQNLEETLLGYRL